MNRVLAIAGLEVRQTLRSRAALLYIIVLPLVFTFIMTQIYGGGGDPAGVAARIGVVCLDQSHEADRFVSNLKTMEGIETITYTERVLKRDLARVNRSISLGLVIPPGFGAFARGGGTPAITELLPGSPSSDTLLAERAVVRAAAPINAAVMAARVTSELLSTPAGSDLCQSVQDGAYELWLTRPEIEVVVSSVGQTPLPPQASKGQASVGMMVMFVMISLSEGAATFQIDKRRFTLSRLFAAPLRPLQVLAGKALGIMAVGMLQTVLLIVSGQLLFQTDYGANLGPILLTLLAFNLAVTGLGVLIASVAKNQAQIGVLSNLAAIIGAMLGGAWWPYELMSPVMRTLGLFTPAGWAIQAVSRLLNGGSLAGTVPSILVLVLMGGLFLCAGALGFRPERVARG